MITNKSVRAWCGVSQNASLEFNIYQVDRLRENCNTLMFINDTSVDLRKLDKLCEHCAFLISDEYNSLEIPISEINDFIIVSNPKFQFSYVVDKLGSESRFQADGAEEFIKGSDCHIDQGAIIGGEDFSPVMGDSRSELIQFPQMGGVKLGDNVLIKYNTMVGRGTFDYTVIGDNTMIDFGCQIGHNCQIGKSCIIAAGTIIGGSTTVGNNVTIGIGAKIRNGLRIGNNVSIGMGAVVINDIPDNTVVVGNPARPINHKHIFSEEGLV